MNESEMIKLLSDDDYHSIDKIVDEAMDNDNNRQLLFSIVEELFMDDSLDIDINDTETSEEDARIIFNKLNILHHSMKTIFELGEWSSDLIQPIVPCIINFLDYNYHEITEDAAKIIAYATNKDNGDLMRYAVPKLVNLLEYKEYLITTPEGDKKFNNMDSVQNAEFALLAISIFQPESLKDVIPALRKFIRTTTQSYSSKSQILGVMQMVSEHRADIIKPIIPDIIESLDEDEHILIIGNMAKNDVESVKTAIGPLIKRLDDKKLREMSAYVLNIIAQKKVEFVEHAISKLEELLSCDDEWTKIYAARTLKVIYQQRKILMDSTVIERLDSIANSENLLHEFDHLKNKDTSGIYDIISKSLVNNPNDPDVLAAYGEALIFNTPDYDFGKKLIIESKKRGIEYIKRSVEIRPDFEYYKLIGRGYEFLSFEIPHKGPLKFRDWTKEDAVEIIKKSLYYYKKASELRPDDVDCQLDIVRKYSILEEYDSAIHLSEELYGKYPKNYDVWEKLRDCYVDKAEKLNNEQKSYDAGMFLLKAYNIDNAYLFGEEFLKVLKDEKFRSNLRSQSNDLKKKNDNLNKDLAKKFSDAGELAYRECKTDPNSLSTDTKIKFDEILTIENSTNKAIQETESIKTREKKSGFFAKIGDMFSSTAKQGKLKIDMYNLEKKRKDTINSFGESLFKSYKNGDNMPVCISGILKDMEDINKQIDNNNEKINNSDKLLNELYRKSIDI